MKGCNGDWKVEPSHWYIWVIPTKCACQVSFSYLTSIWKRDKGGTAVFQGQINGETLISSFLIDLHFMKFLILYKLAW